MSAGMRLLGAIVIDLGSNDRRGDISPEGSAAYLISIAKAFIAAMGGARR